MLDWLYGSIKSKTMWWSALLAALGVLEASTGVLREAIPPQYYGPAVVVIGAVTAMLRVLTSKALAEK